MIQVHLRQRGLRHRLPSQELDDLVCIVEKLVEDRDPIRGVAKKKIEWEEHAKLSEYVSQVLVATIRGTNLKPYVYFPSWNWVPNDCSWIHDGIQHKVCYEPSALEKTILVVGDAAAFGDRTIVESCKQKGEFSHYPFKEIWFASAFFPIPGIERLK